MKPTKKINGVSELTPEQEDMRMQVVDLELKARYWKAQFEIRNYTLENERIQPEYNAFLEAQQKKNEELQAEFKRQYEELQKNQNISVEPDKTTVYDENDTLPLNVDSIP